MWQMDAVDKERVTEIHPFHYFLFIIALLVDLGCLDKSVDELRLR